MIWSKSLRLPVSYCLDENPNLLLSSTITTRKDREGNAPVFPFKESLANGISVSFSSVWLNDSGRDCVCGVYCPIHRLYKVNRASEGVQTSRLANGTQTCTTTKSNKNTHPQRLTSVLGFCISFAGPFLTMNRIPVLLLQSFQQR